MRSPLTVLIAAGCSMVWSVAPAQTSPNVASVINSVNIDTLSRIVNELTGEVPVMIDGKSVTIASRNHTDPVNWAAEYICQKLASYGYTVRNQHYGTQGRNIYAFLSPTGGPPSEYFILSSHYDAFPYLPEAPGADDNIGSVAVVLEAARILKNAQCERGLMFAFWDDEEVGPDGMHGSRLFADSIALIPDHVAGVINCELLGWDGNADDAMTIHVRPIGNSLALSQAMQEVNAAYAIGLHPTVIDPGEAGSDHSSFWNQGYGALMQAQDVYADLNPGYHTNADRFSSFSLPYYQKMARLAIGTTASLIELSEPLPVELSSFSARKEGGVILLQWETASEVNNFGFEVEKTSAAEGVSPDRWTTIGFVEGGGTSSVRRTYALTDRPTQRGLHRYRLKQIDRDGAFCYSPEQTVDLGGPQAFALDQNHPNPFNPSTFITYELALQSPVRLTVIDVLGREAAVLVDDVRGPGRHRVEWNAGGAPPGVYFYRLSTPASSETRKMLLLK